MRLRNVAGSREAIAASPYVVQDGAAYKGRWNDFFGNDAPLYIEIGTGKGQFILEMARRNPDVHYVGIEKFSSVLLRAVQKKEAAAAAGEALSNLCFLRLDAEDILSVFAPGEAAGIYLNFSDPWPKDRHAKRRLMSRTFLDRYRQILQPDGFVEFKTDNAPLFSFALEELEPAGWAADWAIWDLHHDAERLEGNVTTEYEDRFVRQGMAIMKYRIHPLPASDHS